MYKAQIYLFGYLYICIIAHYWPLSAGRAQGHDHAFSLFNQDIGTSSRADKSAVGAINRPLRFGPNAIPQSEAYEFVTSLEAKQLRVHCATVANHQAAQHFYLLSLTGGIPFKRDMLGQLLNRLSVVPLFLSFRHIQSISNRRHYHLRTMVPCTTEAIQGCSFGAGAAVYKIHPDTRLNKKKIAILPYSMLEYLTRQYGGVTLTCKTILFTSTLRAPGVS